MKVLIDTNVVLDVLCQRAGFIEASSKVWKYCELGKIDGYLSALSVPNIIYIMRKELDPQKVQTIIEKLMLIFKVTDLKVSDLSNAAKMFTSDFEDAVQMCCAERIKADYIITRNIKDFTASNIEVLEPIEFLKLL